MPQLTCPTVGLNFSGENIQQAALGEIIASEQHDLVAPLHGEADILENNSPFTVLLTPLTVRMSLPASRLGSKPTKGCLREDCGISANSSFSNCFCRDEACRDFEALALKRRIKSLSSSALSEFFLF